MLTNENQGSRERILSLCDHTELAVTAQVADILRTAEEGLRFSCASICIPPRYVGAACEFLAGKLPVCTVIGFPSGYMTTAVKCFEARDAVRAGAKEIDMVIAIGELLAGNDAAVLDDILAVREACPDAVLKVIVETAKLDEDAKRRVCGIVSRSGADFIKTSTGFGGGGASVADIALFRRECDPALKIKAAGGIASFEDAEAMLAAGADRLGTSRLVKLMLRENVT